MGSYIGILVRGLLGSGAVVTTITTGYVYSDEIGNSLVNLIPRNPVNIWNWWIKEVGIEDVDCFFDERGISRTCKLDGEKLRKVKFFGKDDIDLKEGETVNLRVERGHNPINFPNNLRFTFTNTNRDKDLKIGSSVLKGLSGYDYRIKNIDKNNVLVRAWNLEKLGEKVGLKCEEDGVYCDVLWNGRVNVWGNSNSYTMGAKVEKGKKLKVTKESNGYFEGFKFEVMGEGDIDLLGGRRVGEEEITKLIKDNKTYEIKVKNTKNAKV